MNELYLITVLSSLQVLCVVLFAFSLAIGGILYFMTMDQDADKVSKSYDMTAYNAIRYRKRLFILAVVFGIFTVLIPQKKDMYIIYGVGSTIDYIRSNDKAKQLPDKVINALNKWADELNSEEEENNYRADRVNRYRNR